LRLIVFHFPIYLLGSHRKNTKFIAKFDAIFYDVLNFSAKNGYFDLSTQRRIYTLDATLHKFIAKQF